jgi:hypothetical protein
LEPNNVRERAMHFLKMCVEEHIRRHHAQVRVPRRA